MNILLAIDDSMFSEAATRAVIEQFQPQKVIVRIFHVVTPPQMDPKGMRCNSGPLLEEGEKLVKGAAKTLREAGFSQVTTMVQEGEARSLILDQADSWPADVVVLGSQGKKKLTRFLLGSVSEAVARHARCSVTIIRIPLKS